MPQGKRDCFQENLWALCNLVPRVSHLDAPKSKRGETRKMRDPGNKVGCFAGLKEKGRSNEVTVRRGSTVISIF